MVAVQQRQGPPPELLRNCLVDQNTLHRIADGGTGALGIEEDAGTHVQVCLIVDIDVAHALAGADHWYAGLLGHGPDQPGATPGDQHVHIAVQVHQLIGGLVAGVLHQGDAVLRQTYGPQGLTHQLRHTAVGADGLLAASEDTHIAGLQAQRRSVYGDVGPGLKDDGDDPQGHPPPADDKAVGPGFHLVHSADGIRKGSHLPHAVHDACHPFRRQGQPVQHGGAHPRLLRGGHVFCVGGEPLCLPLCQNVRNGIQRRVFPGRPGGGQNVGGGLCRLSLLL